jgi:hypothetical protein
MKTYTFKAYSLFAEAWLLTAFARLLLLTVSFKKLTPLLGKQVNKKEGQTLTILGNRYKAISMAIERAARYSPWRVACFEQAIAAKLMLKFRGEGSTVNFGVKKTADEKMLAHAWVICNNELITGGKDYEGFVIVNSFEN